jgi:hypothetical protein
LFNELGDEEYRKRYEKYTEREMQKVGKKNSISPLEALKKKKLTPASGKVKERD